MIFLHSVQSITSISLMIVLGAYLTHIGWFDDRSSQLFVKLVVNISAPLMLMYNLFSTYDSTELIQAFSGLLVPVVSMTLCYFFAIVLGRIIKIDKSKIGVFKTMFYCSNTIFMGLPINVALFGEESIPYVFMYFMANTMFFWTLGIYDIAKDGDYLSGSFFSLKSIKKVLSPPLMGVIVAVLLIFAGFNPPKFLMDTCKYLGNLTTPLSMLFIGLSIYKTGIAHIKPSIEMAIILAGRFIVSPLTVFLLSLIFPMPRLMRNVFILQAAMPVMTSISMVAKSYNADYSYTSIMITSSTLACMFAIPLLNMVLAYI